MALPFDEKSFGEEFLDEIISWIHAHMDPIEVFPLEELIQSVKDEGHTVDGEEA